MNQVKNIAQTTLDLSKNPYHIELDVFEGPLDLLLHLIKENDVDIFNIPIANITDQYVQFIETMQSLNLDIAGEFLLMASTLAHIKSKMLLPPEPSDEEDFDAGQDPREELVRRLLEYQKYKQSALHMESRLQLGRDVFVRQGKSKNLLPDQPIELAEISIFKLVESFHRILGNLQLNITHDVENETFSIADSASFIQHRLAKLKGGQMRFTELFAERGKGSIKYGEVVACFLAILSMMKRGVLKVVQTEDFEDMFLMPTQTFHEGAWTYDGTEFDQ